MTQQQLVTKEKRGRRYYLLGNTYPLKTELRNAGCNWDSEEKAWWTGKKDIAERFENRKIERKETLGDDLEVIGSAKYKGKTYRLVWEGVGKYGPCCKLAFRDGSKVFFADAEKVTVVKRYQHPRTIGDLNAFVEEIKEAEKTGDICCECGKPGNGNLVADLEDGAPKHLWCCDIPPF